MGLRDVEVVSQRDPVAFSDSLNLMLAVTVECRPLNRRGTFETPIKFNHLPMVLYS